MNKYIALLLLVLSCLLPGTPVLAEKIELEKKDYLILVVGNYVHGFKEFETSVTSFNDSLSIGIYYDESTQSEIRANQLAKRFRFQIPRKLSQYPWAKDIEIIVNVYSEDRTGRGY